MYLSGEKRSLLRGGSPPLALDGAMPVPDLEDIRFLRFGEQSFSNALSLLMCVSEINGPTSGTSADGPPKADGHDQAST